MESFNPHFDFENSTESPQDSLQSPNKTQHPPRKKQFECPFPDCGKRFRYNSEKNRHMITHDSTRSYTCDYPFCTKKFKRLDALKVHRQSHSKQPQFVCPVLECGLQFKDRPALKYHLNRQHSLSKEEHIPRNLHLLRKEQQQPETSQIYLDSDAIHPKKDFRDRVNNEQKTFYDEIESIDMINVSPDLRSFPSEGFSPKPEKLLCIEVEKADSSSLNHDSGYSQWLKEMKSPRAKEQSEVVQEESLTPNEVNTIQMLCKKLQLDNQELKKKLSDQMTLFD